jgi:simple sugar transport system permease protein
MKKSIFRTHEFFLMLLLTAITIGIGLASPAFFSIGTLFDVIRNQTVFILFAFTMLPVVILGGLDISFVAVSSLALFFARIILTTLGLATGIGQFYVVASIVGIIVGLLIGWLISSFKLGIFELSLGMAPLIYGLLSFFSTIIPEHGHLQFLDEYNKKWIVTVQSVVGRSGLHVSVITVIITLIGLYLFLRFTTAGRAIYAMGADRSVAIRTGFNIRNIYLTVFALMGALAAIAGVAGSSLGSGGGSFAEKYFKVYATIIIGGASVYGGKGSVFGTMLGVILVGLINEAMIYLRIPTAWGDAFLGIIFIAFVTYQTTESRLNKA